MVSGSNIEREREFYDYILQQIIGLLRTMWSGPRFERRYTR